MTGNHSKTDLLQPALSCWALADGAAGHQSQVKGLGEAVGASIDLVNCRLKFPGKLLPSHLVAQQESSFRWSTNLAELSEPHIIISCGRQAAIAALAIKKRRARKAKLIHLQDPQVSRKQFDFIIAPEHDNLTGQNVLSTLGAMHHLSLSTLQEAAQTGPIGGLEKLTSRFVAVLLGGPNKYYRFGEQDIQQLIQNLKQVAQTDLELAIIPSRRTPVRATAALKETFGEDHFVWNGDGENPYLAALALCSYCIVTSDSISMISEATATGQPVYIHMLNERKPAPKFRHFHQSMIESGYARSLSGHPLEDWAYEPPNEAARIASMILDQLISES